jgi:hypothetical protein
MNTTQRLLHTLTHAFFRHLPAICAAIILIVGIVTLVAYFPKTPSARRAMAQEQWANQPFEGYRISMRVEYLNQACFQEIEVEQERVSKVISDTCQSSSFSSMTIGRLFEISGRVLQAPTCYADTEPCACRQARLGSITYDATFGFPHEINYRRVVQPNWTHPDFWKRLWGRRTMPKCELTRSTRIVVLSFAPLP